MSDVSLWGSRTVRSGTAYHIELVSATIAIACVNVNTPNISWVPIRVVKYPALTIETDNAVEDVAHLLCVVGRVDDLFDAFCLPGILPLKLREELYQCFVHFAVVEKADREELVIPLERGSTGTNSMCWKPMVSGVEQISIHFRGT